jgi:hypothetical protein
MAVFICIQSVFKNKSRILERSHWFLQTFMGTTFLDQQLITKFRRIIHIGKFSFDTNIICIHCNRSIFFTTNQGHYSLFSSILDIGFLLPAS